MYKIAVIIVTLFVEMVFAGQSKVIRKELVWDDGFNCIIMIDTSSSNVRIWNYGKNTFYRYPVKYDCEGSGHLASMNLFDKNGFSFGSAECFGSKKTSGTCEYKIDNNSQRINDYFNLTATKSN